MAQPPLKEMIAKQTDEPPPILGTWSRLYAAVLIHLAFWVLVFYLFTTRFHLSS